MGEIFKVLLDQIMAVRDSGLVNMLDTKGVQRVADGMGFYDLVVFIEEQRAEYWRFIMDGDVRHLGAPSEDIL